MSALPLMQTEPPTKKKKKSLHSCHNSSCFMSHTRFVFASAVGCFDKKINDLKYKFFLKSMNLILYLKPVVFF